MLKPLDTILFATNLNENCRDAFDFTAVLATQFQAKIVLLHVLEKMPDYIEGRLQGMLGKEKFGTLGQCPGKQGPPAADWKKIDQSDDSKSIGRILQYRRYR